MVTNVAVPGGWEIAALMLIMSAALLARVLLPVYLVVRLATRPRHPPVEDERN